MHVDLPLCTTLFIQDGCTKFKKNITKEELIHAADSIQLTIKNYKSNIGCSFTVKLSRYTALSANLKYMIRYSNAIHIQTQIVTTI